MALQVDTERSRNTDREQSIVSTLLLSRLALRSADSESRSFSTQSQQGEKEPSLQDGDEGHS